MYKVLYLKRVGNFKKEKEFFGFFKKLRVWPLESWVPMILGRGIAGTLGFGE
jgi:hypothetical protein